MQTGGSAKADRCPKTDTHKRRLSPTIQAFILLVQILIYKKQTDAASKKIEKGEKSCNLF